MSYKIKREILEVKVLLGCIPAPVVMLFAVSVVMMNLLANKSINLNWEYMALDCGILISWVSFLSMDIVTKHFGPKAATELSAVVVLVNLMCCGFFYAAGSIPGVWGESYVAGSESVINSALDGTIRGTWYVLLGSTLAFLSSAVINNFLNHGIGRLLRNRPDGFGAYALRSYVSTAIGQFCDNLVFALVVSRVFFGWSLTQCLVCSLTGMAVELALEALFSPMGYKICKSWREKDVGGEYFALRGER